MIRLITISYVILTASLLHADSLAKEVFDDLVASIGRQYPSAPDLIIDESNRGNGIPYITEYGSIHVGEDFIDFCRSQGNDSSNILALVLGHELGHYYNEHFWAFQYGSAYADVNWAEKIVETNALVDELGLHESQADEFGLFYSYLAGYQIENASTYLEKIYKFYGLPAQLPLYPSLSQRQAILDNAQFRIKNLSSFFRLGTLLVVLSHALYGADQEATLLRAANCYRHIINERFSSPEIYCNLGSVYLKLALMYSSDPLNYPIYFDLKSRINNDVNKNYTVKGSPASKGDSIVTFNRYIELARRNFQFALLQNENCHAAQLNMITIYLLTDDLDRARLELEVLSKEAKKGTLLLSALAKVRSNKMNAAKRILAQLHKQGDQIASQNLEILTGKKVSVGIGDGEVNAYIPSLVEGKSVQALIALAQLREPTNQITNSLKSRDGYMQVTKRSLPDLTCYELYDERRLLGSQTNYYSFIYTNSENSRHSLDYTVQDEVSKIPQKPDFVLLAGTYQLQLFTSKKLIVGVKDNHIQSLTWYQHN